MADNNSLQAVHRLKYRQGDLIVKENDFGVSVYKILQGRVRVVTESGGEEVQLGILGPGQVIGEMLFLNRAAQRRSASARAMEEVELEVWHPSLLAKEYEAMPPIIKYIADQALKRLIMINNFVTRLAAQAEEKQLLKRRDPWATNRKFYRKKVDLFFTGRAFDSALQLYGQIRDISLGGLGVEVKAGKSRPVPFKVGHKFVISTKLPNGRAIDLPVQLNSIRPASQNGSTFCGLSFLELSEQVKKELGFFLMSD